MITSHISYYAWKMHVICRPLKHQNTKIAKKWLSVDFVKKWLINLIYIKKLSAC